ncbi:MAG: propionyl-CoA synthetase, partial [Pirellulales bacterium]|nr:propionyl-CoA synthetase [Pirellulales bacterium]
MSYRQEYQASIDDPEAFWAEKAKLIAWSRDPQTILSLHDHGVHRWYGDGELNTCYLALDYHVEHGRAD